MSVKIVTGNIFTTECQVLVNAINCVGVMGAGIALECRLRYPEMHEKYIQLCDKHKIDIGLLWLYKCPERWILNFPTKKHWKYPSKKEYLHAGLQKLCDSYQARGIKSIAFPLLGADKGGIPTEESMSIMQSYLRNIDIPVEIYKYDPKAKDDLYDKTKGWLLNQDLTEISETMKLRKDYVEKVILGMKRTDINQLNQLARVRGIGIKTLEKIFTFASNDNKVIKQQTLFNG